jgi:hypothetical protein
LLHLTAAPWARNPLKRHSRTLAQGASPPADLHFMPTLRSYWRWLGRRLRLSQPGRVLFTGALLVGVAGIAVARAGGDREGGAAQGSAPDPQQTEGAGTPPRSIAVPRHINAAARDVDGCLPPLTIVKLNCRESDVPIEHRLQAASSGVALPMVSTGPSCHRSVAGARPSGGARVERLSSSGASQDDEGVSGPPR